ncbi:MAG: MBL fold metallo-hydrolase [Patescibacteria group bacterium]|nr:MBL fold metallo-hydrolase [Patescibacteria group bacterium]
MQKKTTILIILFILNLFSWSIIFEQSQDKGLEVCFLDIGQGDSIFIETSQGHQVLIDSGPDNTLIKKLEQRMPFWDRTIDLIILTHSDKDHVFGFLEVLENYEIKNILWTGAIGKSSLFEEWQEAIKNEGSNIWIAERGLVIHLPGERFFEILYPFQSLEGRQVSAMNDTSIVMMLNTDEEKILFTGDISKTIENALIENEILLKADILKVPHHGSKTSSSEEFLKAVDPDLAIISVGRDNSYGHPSPIVLARLEESGIKVLQTSKEKDICLIQKKNEPFLFLSQTQ